MPTLNLGIVAHVDAGKTTLTERLLYETGVITALGRVDHGDTTTDTDTLERRRGITIRSAVVTFTLRPVDGASVKINLIDTPGHSDFVAEVERALGVLDGAVLVVSAVEGVQAQTRVLIRILEQLGIPFLIFVNKIDRVGASYGATLGAIRNALAGDAVALTAPHDLGSRSATVSRRAGQEFVTELTERLTEHDDALLARYVGAGMLTLAETFGGLSRLTATGRLHPTYFGAALMGTGVGELIADLATYLPAAAGLADAPLQAGVFKIERGPGGQKIAYARLRSGTLAARDHVTVHHRSATGAVIAREARVTAVRTFCTGSETSETAARADEIATVVGLGDLQIGDQLGAWSATFGSRHFAAPGLEAAVHARRPADRPALFAALRELSEQDPLIDARLDGLDEEVTVSLYGEVQKEVLQARLADEYGVEAEFQSTQTVFVERVSGVGEAVEVVSTQNATVGLRIEPGSIGSEFGYGLAVERGWLLPSFHTAIEETLARELPEGLYGWRVLDCVVTLIASRFSAPTPPAGYFRELTTIALGKALRRAGTTVCEPISEFEVEFPADSMSRVLQKLLVAGAAPGEPVLGEQRGRLTGSMPTAAVHGFEQRLPDLTQGEGVFLARPAGYRPVAGAPPRRRSTSTANLPVDGTGTS